MFKHLLVPTDGSKLSLGALDIAADMASGSDTKISVLHVCPTYPTMVGGDGYMVAPITSKEWDASIAKLTARVQEAVEKRAKSKSVTVQFLSATTDQPYVAIIDTAKKKKCDLIVMSSHGRKGISAMLLGSETTKVLTHCKVPVLVCR
ncbi:MAG: universal stress protein [Usitatibacteraceae bacterium]